MKLAKILLLVLLCPVMVLAKGERKREAVVLEGVLHRGGGGKAGLSESTLTSMCGEYSRAIYLYADETQNKNFKCPGSDEVFYINSGFGYKSQDTARPALQAVYDAIVNQTGPVYVHCWNGWHAAGEVAAVALKQFCGYSDEDAAQYWKNTIGDQFKSSYNSILNRIRKFQPYSDLQISQAQKSRICP